MNLHQIKSINWMPQNKRHNDVFIGAIIQEGFDPKYFKLLGAGQFHLANCLTFSDTNIYLNEEEYQENVLEMSKLSESLGQFVEEITNKFTIVLDSFAQTVQNLKTINFTDVSIDLVKEKWHEFIDNYYCLMPYVVVVSTHLEKVACKIIMSEIENQVDDPQQVYATLCSPTELNMINKEALNRLHIASIVKEKPKKAKVLITKHIQEFGYLKCFYITDDPYLFEEITTAVQDIIKIKNPQKEIERIEQQRLETSKKRSQLIKALKLSSNTRLLIEGMSQNAFLRTHRKEVMLAGNFYARSLLTRIANELNLELEDLQYLAPSEITCGLNTGKLPSKKEIEQRKHSWVVVRFDGKDCVLTGEDVEKINPAKQVAAQESVIGISAYPGKVVGKVQVIRSRHDMAHFERGSILVAPNVSTYMTPLVEKCCGIITNEGGMLSHTAIVAREFAKPCLLGTKIATDIFKDGDLVELDAEKGIAKKIGSLITLWSRDTFP